MAEYSWTDSNQSFQIGKITGRPEQPTETDEPAGDSEPSSPTVIFNNQEGATVGYQMDSFRGDVRISPEGIELIPAEETTDRTEPTPANERPSTAPVAVTFSDRPTGAFLDAPARTPHQLKEVAASVHEGLYPVGMGLYERPQVLPSSIETLGKVGIVVSDVDPYESDSPQKLALADGEVFVRFLHELNATPDTGAESKEILALIDHMLHDASTDIGRTTRDKTHIPDSTSGVFFEHLAAIAEAVRDNPFATPEQKNKFERLLGIEQQKDASAEKIQAAHQLEAHGLLNDRPITEDELPSNPMVKALGEARTPEEIIRVWDEGFLQPLTTLGAKNRTRTTEVRVNNALSVADHSRSELMAHLDRVYRHDRHQAIQEAPKLDCLNGIIKKLKAWLNR